MKQLMKFLIATMLVVSFFEVDAQIKISALPTLTAPDSSADLIPIVHSGTTYKITPGKLFHEFGGSGGGSGSPGGSNTHIQFNNSGAFGGSADFTWDNGTKFLTAVADGGVVFSTTTYTDGLFKLDVERVSLGDVTAQGNGTYLFINDNIGQTIDFRANEIRLPTIVGSPTAEMKFFELVANGSGYVGFKAPDAITTSQTYTWPATVGSAGSVLIDATGSGDLAWGGIGGAAGDDWEIQFNDGTGAFDASADLTFNPSSGRFEVAESGTPHILIDPDDGLFLFGNTESDGLGLTLSVSSDLAVLQSGESSGDQNAITLAPTYTSFQQLIGGAVLRLYDDNGAANFTGFKSPDARSTDLIYTLPSTDPTSGQVLSAGTPSGGFSTLTWATPSTPGDAAADAATKGVSTYAINDFNSSAGLISIDYTNGQAASGSTKGFLSSADWSTFNGKQAAGSYLVASGATTGATSQPQVFTNGIKSSGIDDNTDGTIELTFSSVPLIAFNSFGIQVPDGTFSNPSYLFAGSSNTGYYLKSTTEIGAAIGGALKGGFNSSGLFTDVVSEQTAAAGVTVDGVLLKDGLILGDYGGTGVNNSGKTITLGGNLTTSGANALTFTTAGATNVTLPTSGTLVNTGVTTLSSLASIGTVTTGTWQGSVIAGQYGGTGVANTGKTITVSGNTTIGSSTNTVAFATSGNTSVTLPTTGTLATLAGTETLTNKSIVGTQLTGTSYTFAANNTNGTAAYTLQPYEDHPIATYSPTIDFNSTDPTSLVSSQYAWSRIGNTVTLTIAAFWSGAGVTNTMATIPMPSDCPSPAVIAGAGDAASEFMYTGTGRVEANMTANPTAVRVGMRRNAANDAFEIQTMFGSTSAQHLEVTITYRTN